MKKNLDLNSVDPLLLTLGGTRPAKIVKRHYGPRRAPAPVKPPYEPYKDEPGFGYYARFGGGPYQEAFNHFKPNGEPRKPQSAIDQAIERAGANALAEAKSKSLMAAPRVPYKDKAPPKTARKPGEPVPVIEARYASGTGTAYYDGEDCGDTPCFGSPAGCHNAPSVGVRDDTPYTGLRATLMKIVKMTSHSEVESFLSQRFGIHRVMDIDPEDVATIQAAADYWLEQLVKRAAKRAEQEEARKRNAPERTIAPVWSFIGSLRLGIFKNLVSFNVMVDAEKMQATASALIAGKESSFTVSGHNSIGPYYVGGAPHDPLTIIVVARWVLKEALKIEHGTHDALRVDEAIPFPTQ